MFVRNPRLKLCLRHNLKYLFLLWFCSTVCRTYGQKSPGNRYKCLYTYTHQHECNRILCHRFCTAFTNYFCSIFCTKNTGRPTIMMTNEKKSLRLFINFASSGRLLLSIQWRPYMYHGKFFFDEYKPFSGVQLIETRRHHSGRVAMLSSHSNEQGSCSIIYIPGTISTSQRQERKRNDLCTTSL